MITIKISLILFICTLYILVVLFVLNKGYDSGKLQTYLTICSFTLPFSFSLIIYLLDSIRYTVESKRKAKNETIELISNEIKHFNLLISKAVKRNNLLISEYDYIHSILNRFSEIDYFEKIIKYWTCEINSRAELANDYKFRTILRDQIDTILRFFYKDGTFIHELDFLSAMKMSAFRKPTFSIEDSMFIYQIRKKLNLDLETGNLFFIYPEAYGDGNVNDHSVADFNEAVRNIETVFEHMIRPRIIDPNQLKSLIYTVLLKYFEIMEKYTEEIILGKYFIESFQKAFLELNSKYKYQSSIELISEITIEESENFKFYIDKKNLFSRILK